MAACLVVKESDNNVKLIVLDRLDALHSKHSHLLDGLIMDVLQALSSADIEVRRMAMAIDLSMTSSQNVEEVLLSLKKQLLRMQEQNFEKVCTPSFSLFQSLTIVLGEKRQLLIQSIHVTVTKSSLSLVPHSMI